ncbi:MAG: hypothetical protein LQ338_004223 [Usnochroma carphineum]|nr:MAG: hypothetical protein LQ338_004223 [Usnochroma carphineum]
MGDLPGNPNGSPSDAGAHAADTRTRRADHTPQTAQAETEIYILTLNTDETHHKAVTALRNQYFPPNLNKLSAHVALFRALPGSELPAIEAAVQDVVRQKHPFPISTGKPFLLSRGVGLEVLVPPAQEIFRTLKAQWGSFLSKQDQSFRAHYTIQNKVEDKDIARKTLEEVQKSFAGSTGMVNGLSLYLYSKGYWKLRQFYPFPETQKQEKLPPMDNKGEADWPALPTSKR